ncbi:hypothetical protein C7Y70_02055 [Pseudoalteromonas sp. KS88]|uniref:hypothetical protein n=1 Tax=Pseudoalteromonas sp. KS88 TaxID=2109918 RepID=UPI0010815DB7|nr:hypothetical protein [Pseudoalteromonas sp. KS88]MDB2356106.1 hypothetical protein [Pseudoalteromonas sp.]TGE85515.1 hypothetical protein C7Y70_02055 [Pseudoalteromonas sp. KS88]
MSLLSILVSLLGAFLTFFLAKYERIGAIRASATLSIIAYTLFLFLGLNAELYSMLFFGGTFIGMSAPKRFGFYTLCSASILFSILFHYLVPLLYSYGGALGLSAFLSVCVCHLAILLGAPRSQPKNK